jgi:hypothetical protein
MMVGFLVSALAVLPMGCSKHGLNTGARLPDAGGSPPADDAAGVDRTLDGWRGSDTATEVKPPADAKPESKPGVDGQPSPDASNIGDASRDAAPACILPDGGPGQFDCYVCTCMDNGQPLCSFVGCPDADNARCTLPTAVTFGATDGMVGYEDQYQLNPTSGLIITRTYNGRGPSPVDGATVRACAPALPDCGASSVVSLSTIVSDLADAEVQAAVARGTPAIYGVDQRPIDGSVWSIALASGGSILVGAPCASPAMSSCRPIPDGVQRLANDLQSLAAAMRVQVPCWGL